MNLLRLLVLVCRSHPTDFPPEAEIQAVSSTDWSRSVQGKTFHFAAADGDWLSDVKQNTEGVIRDEEILAYFHEMASSHSDVAISTNVSGPLQQVVYRTYHLEKEKKSIALKTLKTLIEKHADKYCTRILETKDFRSRKNGEYFLAAGEATRIIRKKIFQNNIFKPDMFDSSDWLTVAVATPSKRLLGFFICRIVGSKKKSRVLEIRIFAASPDASYGIRIADARHAVHFYQHCENEARQRGFRKMWLISAPTAERFWYARGFRYSGDCATQLKQPFAFGTSRKMYKCI